MMRKTLKRLGLSGAAVLAGIGIHLAILQAGGNFHAVIAGEYYRSAQLDGAGLRARVAQNGIHSVVNLRGSHPGARWYDEEIAAARDLGLAHYDIPLSESDHIAPDQAARLIEVLKSAPKPVLVHCKAGADRTGLVSSLYLSAIAGRDEEEAEWQLSLLYGHIGLPLLSKAWPMNESWEGLEGWLGYPGS